MNRTAVSVLQELIVQWRERTLNRPFQDKQAMVYNVIRAKTWVNDVFWKYMKLTCK